jgi:hypothetical protein
VAWAVVPLVVMLPLVMLRPTLLRGRYLMFVVPAWAILGGLCIVIVMGLVRRGLARTADRAGSNGAPVRGR